MPQRSHQSELCFNAQRSRPPKRLVTQRRCFITYIIAIIITLFSISTHALDYGIDQLSDPIIKKSLENKKLAVLTHAAARDKFGTHLIDHLYNHFELKKIFAPEHGLRSLEDDWVDDGVDEETGLPIISLYKRSTRAPTTEELKGIDSIVIDLQDVGLRYYTYFSTISHVMKVAARENVEIIILDRPNLLGRTIEGKTLDSELAGHFISYHTVPTRHGMTLGELALMINHESDFKTNIKVVSVKGWQGELLLNKLDRPWLPPSPALISPDQVYFYAFFGHLEHLNLAVGRGINNSKAFKIFGAPWITKQQSQKIVNDLNGLNFKGITFKTYSWKVTRAIFTNQEARGFEVSLSDFDGRSDEIGFKVAQVLFRHLSKNLVPNDYFIKALGSRTVLQNIKEQTDWKILKPELTMEIFIFRKRSYDYLLKFLQNEKILSSKIHSHESCYASEAGLFPNKKALSSN